jgi:hypothetical protein
MLGALMLLAGAVCFAQETRSIQIRVEAAPRFDVLFHRAKSTATGAVLGGLIGAGIQAGVESDQDADKRSALEPHVSPRIWQDAFMTAMDEALRAKGLEPVWVEGKGAGAADLYLAMSDVSYGYRMTDTTAELVSAFVELDAVYGNKPPDPRKKAAKETFYVTGRNQVTYQDLTAQTASVQSELEQVLGQAARRVANKIAYNVK